MGVFPERIPEVDSKLLPHNRGGKRPTTKSFRAERKIKPKGNTFVDLLLKATEVQHQHSRLSDVHDKLGTLLNEAAQAGDRETNALLASARKQVQQALHNSHRRFVELRLQAERLADKKK